MAEPSIGQELYLPCLLDRLTDENPRAKSEPRGERAMRLRELRQGVLRDLEWLMNTGRTLSQDRLDDYPAIRTSVLNYGIPSLPGITGSTQTWRAIASEIREALVVYEPRLQSETLKVSLEAAADPAAPRSLAFVIEAVLAAEPYLEQLFVKTSFDLESEKCTVEAR